jgi:cytoplasmic iron level regulating protein YaaA (DUF328/UPF0246 family)
VLLLIASAKKLDFATPVQPPHVSQPTQLKQAKVLAGRLKALDLQGLAALMGLSDDLAALTAGRYRAWKPPFTETNARPALLAYAGDAYGALDAASLDAADLGFAQEHLRILSGLYGLLRPLDLIQPYRLEMGARLANPSGQDLYAFWRAPLSAALAKTLEADGGPLVNLASGEFFGALDPGALPGRIVTPVFEERSARGFKVVSFHAKRARGLMCRHAIRRRLERAEDLQSFDAEGYAFIPEASAPDRWVFRR